MKSDPMTVRKCYTHDTGAAPEFNQRAFMDWCERMVGEWKAKVEALGYAWPRWDIPEDYHGRKSYHEWLKERVGL